MLTLVALACTLCLKCALGGRQVARLRVSERAEECGGVAHSQGSAQSIKCNAKGWIVTPYTALYLRSWFLVLGQRRCKTHDPDQCTLSGPLIHATVDTRPCDATLPASKHSNLTADVNAMGCVRTEAIVGHGDGPSSGEESDATGLCEV